MVDNEYFLVFPFLKSSSKELSINHLTENAIIERIVSDFITSQGGSSNIANGNSDLSRGGDAIQLAQNICQLRADVRENGSLIDVCNKRGMSNISKTSDLESRIISIVDLFLTTCYTMESVLCRDALLRMMDEFLLPDKIDRMDSGVWDEEEIRTEINHFFIFFICENLMHMTAKENPHLTDPTTSILRENLIPFVKSDLSIYEERMAEHPWPSRVSEISFNKIFEDILKTFEIGHQSRSNNSST